MARDIEQLRTLVQSLRSDPASIATTHTLRPAEATRREPLTLLEELPRIGLEARADAPAELRILDTLGEGGMGVVRLAAQPALDRRVAVKTLRDGVPERALRSLLEEARVTGRLEHPNVIPIHALGRDADGAPLIVMKHVDGVSWADVIRDPAQAPATDRADLEWHLGILGRVADALRFAHSRGVIHRDLKPENVMIGAFGEVYLLDWGVALPLAERKPAAPDPSTGRVRQELVGTPAYMAPELATGAVQEVDERTDVYLLGATLHAILTGRPRHQGDKIMQVLLSAMESAPYPYGDDVPAELAAIANRACHADKDARFSSVEAFQEAIASFLEHRGSVGVSARAEASLEALEALLAEADAQPSLDQDTERRLHDLFGECRFGFRQALAMWPDNEAARAGLQRCAEAMARHYVRHENAAAARSALAELPAPVPALEADVTALAAALEERAAETARLRKAAAAFDLTTSSRARGLFMLAIGVMFAATTFWTGWRMRHGLIEDRLENQMWAVLRTLAIVALATFVLRRSLFANAGNRRLMYVLFGAIGVIAVGRWIAWQHDVPYIALHGIEMVFYGFVGAVIGLLSNARIVLFALVYPAAAAVALAIPVWASEVLGVAHLTFASLLAWSWRPR